MALEVKNLPVNSGAVRETQVWSLDQKDALEEGMATHSSILAWRIPWTEKPGRLQSIGSQRAGLDWNNLAGMHPSVNGQMLIQSIQKCQYQFSKPPEETRKRMSRPKK